jgi:predicted phosphodiesterase
VAALLIISDSHGNLPALTAALRWAAQQRWAARRSEAAQRSEAARQDGPGPLTAAVFLGDGAEDLDKASAQAGFTPPWYRVRGNGDLDFSIPESLVLEVPAGPENPGAQAGRGGRTKPDNPSAVRRLFLAHGNRYAVDGGSGAIAAAARAAGAEAALYGHTHVPLCGETEGIFTLNPGSIGRPRSRVGPTFAVLDCLPGRLEGQAGAPWNPPGGGQGPDAPADRPPLFSARFYGLVNRGQAGPRVRELDLFPTVQHTADLS